MATDYEKKYKEALERARELYNDAKANEYKSDMEDYESIFPELAESEDERIRKNLKDFLRRIANGEMNDRGTMPSAEKCQKWIAYLEKQKNQNPAEWNKEDKEMFEAVDESLYCYGSGKAQEVVAQIEAERRWFYSLPERFNLQPKQEWSEEDEKILDGIINTLDRLGYAEFCKSSREEDIEEERFYYKEIQCLKKLKSLRPSWKPSEEQMDALHRCVDYLHGEGSGYFDPINSLYEQLKKL